MRDSYYCIVRVSCDKCTKRINVEGHLVARRLRRTRATATTQEQYNAVIISGI